MLENIDFTNLKTLLEWLAGPVGMAWWMMFASDLIRNLRYDAHSPTDEPLAYKLSTWLNARKPGTLQVLVTVFSLVPPTLAYIALGLLTEETYLLLQPYFSYVALAFSTLLAQKVWYNATKPK